MKATAKAPSNIALIKYWGKSDETLRIPTNDNISINLSNLYTTTTIEFSPKYKYDEITINGVSNTDMNKRVSTHLDRIKKLAKIDFYARVVSVSNFPAGAGLASSASGFAALTLSSIHALNLNLAECETSALARLGSGSACRSIPDGIVEWKKGNNHKTSYAYTLFRPDYLSISIIAAILQKHGKKTGSTLGMKNLHNNIFFKERIKNLSKRLKELKRLLKIKDYDGIFQLAEKEALELHAMVMTTPPYTNLYWSPDTIKLINFVWDMRDNNIPVYFTIDAGPNVFLLCKNRYEDIVLKKLRNESYIKEIIVNKPSIGTRVINEHLF